PFSFFLYVPTRRSSDLFIDGILANIFVNITIMGQMKMKDDIGRLLFIIAVIFLFVYGGLEHIIANFSLMSIAFFSGNDMDMMAVDLKSTSLNSSHVSIS